MTPKPRPRGRPRLPKGTALKSEHGTNVALTKLQRKAFDEAAKASGRTLASWMRFCCLERIRRNTVLGESGSDECDECDGSGVYLLDGQPQACICTEAPQKGIEQS